MYCTHCCRTLANQTLYEAHFVGGKSKCVIDSEAGAGLDDKGLSEYYAYTPSYVRSPLNARSPHDFGLPDYSSGLKKIPEKSRFSGSDGSDSDDSGYHDGLDDGSDYDGSDDDRSFDAAEGSRKEAFSEKELLAMGTDISIPAYQLAEMGESEYESSEPEDLDLGFIQQLPLYPGTPITTPGTPTGTPLMASVGTPLTATTVGTPLQEESVKSVVAIRKKTLAEWKEIFGENVDMRLMEKREKARLSGHLGNKFSVPQEIRIELAAKLDQAKAPLVAYDSLLKWAQTLAPSMAASISGSRKTLIKELKERYGEETNPEVVKVPLRAKHPDAPDRVADVTVNDTIEGIYQLLTEESLDLSRTRIECLEVNFLGIHQIQIPRSETIWTLPNNTSQHGKQNVPGKIFHLVWSSNWYPFYWHVTKPIPTSWANLPSRLFVTV